MKTYQAKKEELDHKWYLVNAEGKVLGRLSTELVKILKGKNKPTYTPMWIREILLSWSMREK